jgi:hypothetical protein
MQSLQKAKMSGPYRVISEVGRDDKDEPVELRATLQSVTDPRERIVLCIFVIPTQVTEENLDKGVMIFDDFLYEALRVLGTVITHPHGSMN